ncbi:hypothetical protein AX15_005934 [Amanita polypyramis BW_CC]|nr:hypothetical protein AX15_005934 [Amanita polypyramis BW_CC]
MPSFLSKVFGRKRQDEKDDRDSAPLGGPFESISPTVSPSAANFPDSVTNGGNKDKEAGFPLFKSKSRAAAAGSHQKPDVAPHLALNLPSSRSQQEDSPTRALDVVFEADFDGRVLLADATIGEQRLSPTETLVLLRACGRSIAARGLETLGIMHPHWYSSSPEVQRKLISLYIHSLAAKSPSNTHPPSSSAILSTFESEVQYVRSPHDVAAVLRWALRHLKLEGDHFGREHDWYKAFFNEERAADYPAKAFSDYLSPRVPASHLVLLCATFEIFSSLAAHAEANGISGSKLSKYFGLWLLTSQRAEEKDSWSTFYERWERTGRILEHLFLARLRDEAVNQRMPVRLMELVKKYPYGSPVDDLPSRPRFSTRQYEAMLVRVETQLTTQREPKHNHSQLISDAFEAEVAADEREYMELWEQIKAKKNDSKSDTSPGDSPDLSHIFADETIRFLSLLPGETPESGSQSYGLFKKSNRKRSLSLNDQDLPASATTSNNGSARHAKTPTELAVATSIAPERRPVTRDWTQFSASGFAESGTLETRLASTLMDKDMEATAPGLSSLSRNSRLTPGPLASWRSMETPASPTTATEKDESPLVSSFKVAQFSPVQLDEAFVDFWSDALTDPISLNWPPFVLCKLKPDVAGTTKSGKKVDWLVIERSCIKPAVPEPQSTDAGSEYGGKRPTSPRPSIASQGTFSSTKKRFSLFNTSGSRTSLDKRFAVPTRKKANSLSNATKAGKNHSTVRVGEMGEVLREEDEKETPKAGPPSPKPSKSSEVVRKSLEAVKKSVSSSGKKSTEQMLPVPGSPVRDAAPTVKGSIISGVPESEELAVASAASAAAVATSVVTHFGSSGDAPKTKRAEEEVKPSEPVSPIEKPSPPLPSGTSLVEATQPVEEVAMTGSEFLETVAEVTEEPAVQSSQPEPAQQAPAVIESKSLPTVEEGVTGPVVEPTTAEDEIPTVVEPTPAEEPQPAVEDVIHIEETDASVGVELSQSSKEQEPAVEQAKVDVVTKEPVAGGPKAGGPSEPPSGDLAQLEAKVEEISHTNDAEQH